MAAAVIRTQHRWREGFVCDTMKMIDKIRNFPFKGTVIVAVWAMVYGVFREPLSHLLAGPLRWWVGRGAILVGAVSSIWGAAWMIAQTGPWFREGSEQWPASAHSPRRCYRPSVLAMVGSSAIFWKSAGQQEQ